MRGRGIFLYPWLAGMSWQASGQPPAGVEYFEKNIRPLLAEKCYVCHGAQVATSGLRLDSKAGWERGGVRGAAIVAGHPESSVLVRAVSYDDPALKMPPTGRLSDEQIAALVKWVEMGAPDPRTLSPAPPATTIDLEEGRKFWAFQPLSDPAPPAVVDRSWVRSPVDRFLLARLEKKGLRPAPPASRRTLIRRVTFDLTGLPPAPGEVEEFLADRSPRAFEKVVDRLLASPHYGERSARHWLDLVRFGETSGHEFDSEKPDAWRYRDYLIRAFNDDVAYDRLVVEHIAGDLVDGRRQAAGGTHWDTPLATGFFGLHEERNAADDVAEVQVENIDNQIDVLGKTFLGLTVACARCHDHKFDPIPTADYYALAGILHSTRQKEASVDTPAQTAEIEAAARGIAAASREAARALRPALGPAVDGLGAALGQPDARWKAVLERARKERDHVFYPYAVLSQASEKPFGERLAEVRLELAESASAAPREGDIVFADFSRNGYEGWETHGPAFGSAPSVIAPPSQALAGHRGGALANSFGRGANELTGVLLSKTFVISKPYLHVRMAGTVDKTRRREHGALRFTIQMPGRPSFLNADEDGVFSWKTVSLGRQEGQPGYLVIADRSPAGHIVVDKIVFSGSNKPPALTPNPRVVALLGEPGLDSPETLAAAYERMFRRAIEEADPDGDSRWLLAALDPAGRLENLAPLLGGSDRLKLSEAQASRATAASALPASHYGLVSGEGLVRDVALAVRGNLTNPGPVVRRGFLGVLARPDQPKFGEGSGRLEMARIIAGAGNPLTARVMVNRIWKHHFGEGIVRTVDNFGRTGERPSHPELLDYLARRFIASGWSVKAMHRLMVLSSAYRRSDRATPASAKADPQNRWLHHMPVRRLEAEAIRDSILAVAGTLDATLYGPGIVPHISPYQDGRGKPESGPLDGRGRRSLYIQVRRNFLTPLLLVFDYPPPVTTIGRRGTTAVPSQALMMMNNEFVAAQAEKWAARVVAGAAEPKQRIARMFLEAFARPPEPREAAAIETFLAGVSRPEGEAGDARRWAALAHVLINSKEFIFVR